MNESYLHEQLTLLRDVILEERHAARALEVDRMLELTDEKEALLKKLLPMVETMEDLTPEERELAEKIYSENLRNAYFFWSALKWVRASMGFFGDKISPEAYEGSGSMVRGGYSGALLSGRV